MRGKSRSIKTRKSKRAETLESARVEAKLYNKYIERVVKQGNGECKNGLLA